MGQNVTFSQKHVEASSPERRHFTAARVFALRTFRGASSLVLHGCVIFDCLRRRGVACAFRFARRCTDTPAAWSGRARTQSRKVTYHRCSNEVGAAWPSLTESFSAVSY